MEEQEELEVWLGDEPPPTLQFSPVRMDKFIILNLVSFNFYLLIWFYRQWRYVKESEGTNIWPGMRALLGLFTYSRLLSRIPGVENQFLLALTFFLFIFTARLPDPWGLIGILMFLPVVPAVTAINRLNEKVGEKPLSFRWRKRSVVPVVVGIPIVILTLVGLAYPDKVMNGDGMSDDHFAYLQELELVTPDDSVLMFYNFSLTHNGGGVVLTDRGFGGYWIDQVTEAMNTFEVDYAEVVDLEVNFARSWLETTVVRIHAPDGGWLDFTLSTEAGGDRSFIRELRERVEQATPPGGRTTSTM